MGFADKSNLSARWWSKDKCAASYMSITAYAKKGEYTNNDSKKLSLIVGHNDWSTIYDLSPLNRDGAVVPPATQWNNAIGLVSSTVTIAAVVSASLF